MGERNSRKERHERVSTIDKFALILGPRGLADYLQSRREQAEHIRQRRLERANKTWGSRSQLAVRGELPTAGKFAAVMGPEGTADYLDEKAAGEASVLAHKRERLRTKGKTAVASTGIEQP